MKYLRILLLLAALMLPNQPAGAQPPATGKDKPMTGDNCVNNLTAEQLARAPQGPLLKEQLAHHSVRVAAVQASGTRRGYSPGGPQGDPTDLVIGYIDQAGRDKVDLIVFPEGFLGKVPVSEPGAQRIMAAAARNKLYVIIGLYEVLGSAGKYTNNALLIDRTGQIAGRYSKVHPAVGDPPNFWPPREKDFEWQGERGEGFPVFDTDFGRIGIMICYDGYFPETARCLALNGAELIVWINDRNGFIEDHLVKTYTVTSYVHMVCSNWDHGQGTMIAAWPYSILKSIDEPKEGYIMTDLDLETLRQARRNGREYRQREPDLYGPITKPFAVWDNYVNLPKPDQTTTATASAASKGGVTLEPVVVREPLKRAAGMAEGTDLSRLAFHLRAPWMSGPMELRFPEVLRSSMGMHFIDHFSKANPQISEWESYPQWQIDAASGVIRYEFTTPEGLEISGEAVPEAEAVALKMKVVNQTGKAVEGIDPNCCLDLGPCPELNAKWDTSRLFMMLDGQWQSLDHATPTAAEMGREPWLLIQPEWTTKSDLPRVSPTWWKIDQTTAENLMAAVSSDGKHLTGYTWDRRPTYLMSNCGNPCLHTGAGPSGALQNGESVTWNGKIYLMENNPEELLLRYRADQERWKRNDKE